MIEFKDDFFAAEERDGFYIEPMMKRVWAAQMEVLMAVDKVCRENQLHYFVNWGTLLGTIRHKGFVPWDDDIDITMKREDYQRFCQIALGQLPKGYDIINSNRYAEHENMIVRVVNGKDISTSPERLKNFHHCPYAVGIDIDILDYKSRDPKQDDLQLKLTWIVLEAAAAAKKYEAGKMTFEELRTFLDQVEELCNIKLDYGKSLKQQLNILGDQLCMIFSDEDADELQYVGSRIVNRPAYYLPKEWYDEPVYMPFEGVIEVPVPKEFDKILRMQYGEDYMTPCRVDGGHQYPFYRKQEKILNEKLGEGWDASI